MRSRTSGAPRDVAERLTKRRWWRIDREESSLADAAKVRAWLRSLDGSLDQQVLVHREWGTVAAVAEPGRAVTVVLSDGEHAWTAESPDHDEPTDLTPGQVEHVVLESMTSAQRPPFPRWRLLV